MRNKKTLPVLFICFLSFFACPLLYSQATGNLSGTVADKTGSVISGAKVVITSQGTGVIRESSTDATGHYLVPLLPVATYTIHVEAAGFQTVEQKDVKLQVDDHREVNFTLAPGTVSSTVEVSAAEVAVQTTSPALGQVITEQQVAQLPLNGRNFVQLATLTPGTTQETNPHSFFNGGGSSEVSTRGSFSLSVGGSRVSSTDWLLDGNDNNELTAGGISILPSIDAIQEFKVLTYNYSAQYGTRAGPTVLLTTKSGSNQLHGTLFEFLRNTSLDAPSFFAQGQTEKFNLNQFGGSIGGPIKKDKTFFFFDYQGKRSRQGKTFFGGFVPSAAMRTGDFTEKCPEGFTGPGGICSNAAHQIYNPYSTTTTSRDPFFCDGSGNSTAVNANGTQAAGVPCNKIPAALTDPAAAQMINFFPLPNVSGSAAGNYLNSPVKKLDEGEFDIRLDHNFSSKDSLFARFSYDQATVFLPGGSPSFAEPDAFASTQNIDNHGRNVSISETHIFSPNTINQISFGYNRIFNHILSFATGTCLSQQLGIAGANLGCDNSNPPNCDGVSCGLTSTLITGGYWGLGDRGFAPFQGGTNVFHIADSFDMVRGKHNIKIGGEIRANQMNVATNAFQDGFWVFLNPWSASNTFGGGDAMADFLLGLPIVAQHDQTFDGVTSGRRWKLFRPYIQDDWRVTNDLTVNLGLAWALVTPVTEAQNRQANFDFETGRFLIPGQTSDGRVGAEFDKTGLEPRIGLAWKPLGSQKSVIRAGYAIFHDSSWNQGGQGLWENPPFFQSSFFSGFSVGGCPSATTPSGQQTLCASLGMPISGRTMTQGFPILAKLTDPATFGGNIFSQNLDFKQGMVQQYNLAFEHQIPGDVVVTVGYAGSHSTHILVDQMNLNVKSPSACGTVPGYTLGCGLSTTTVPYPQFGNIQNANDIGSARYDSLQVKAETKSARYGLYALLGYTYARAFDSGFSDGLGTTSGATYFPLPGTAKADWALSQINLNHNFTASVIYSLPFGKGKKFGSDWSGPVNAMLGGWQANVIQKITSGFPVFMVTSTNVSGVNFTNNTTNFNRPNQISDPLKGGSVAGNPTCVAPAEVGTINHWFNPCAFVDPPAGELGSANRTPLYGPGFVNTDFSVNKFFPLGFREGTDIEFRAEFFNLFNHPQFYLPVADRTSSNFGAITETVNNPRLIQFALKLRF